MIDPKLFEAVAVARKAHHDAKKQTSAADAADAAALAAYREADAALMAAVQAEVDASGAA